MRRYRRKRLFHNMAERSDVDEKKEMDGRERKRWKKGKRKTAVSIKFA